MRTAIALLLATALAACATKGPAPKSPSEPGSSKVEPSKPVPPSPGEVVHVNEETGVVIVRTQAAAHLSPGVLVAVDIEGGPSVVLRVGSAGDGMVAGVLESGSAIMGPCRVTPLR